jgi:hypothetical protein
VFVRWQLAGLVLATLIGLLLTAQAEPAEPAVTPLPEVISPTTSTRACAPACFS